MATLVFRFGPPLEMVNLEAPAVAGVTYTNQVDAQVDCPDAEAEGQARDYYVPRGWVEVVTP